MNPNLEKLQPYPFEKLGELKAGLSPPEDKPHIALSIGEPKHTPPAFALETLSNNLEKISLYPTTKGNEELRQAILVWLEQRFKIPKGLLNAEEHVLPVNGTREALFSFTQSVINQNKPDALALMPNPFYQIYEGATYLAGAEPYYLPCLEKNNFIPDYDAIDAKIWERCQILFICSPGNPSGAVTSILQFKKLIELAHQYDFIIASDECYSEIFPDENAPPPSLLEACVDAGNTDFKNCIVFHSLSKRSNLPGLRSGFVAGDKSIMKQYLRYRTYHGCAMSTPSQIASIAAWKNEDHVLENRNLYRQKFSLLHKELKSLYDITLPDAGFYFWLKTPISDIEFSKRLFNEQNITVLPGQYLSRTINGINPGENFVRMAIVADLESCKQASERLQTFRKNI